MSKFAFCTITYGKKYVEFGETLISQLNDMGHHVFVLTNEPNHYYLENEKLTVINHDRPYFSFHDKRIVMKECLRHYETAIFLDADVFIENTDNLDFFNDLTSGLHIFGMFGNIGLTFCSEDISKCHFDGHRNTKYGLEGVEFLNKLDLKYKKQFHVGKEDNFLEHFLEGRWAITKENGKEDLFFEIWDKLAVFCEEFDIRYDYVKNIGAGEGGAMSIACHNSGLTFSGVSHLVSLINKIFISNYREKMNGTKPWNIAG
jgi:hypothetical protein